MLLLFLQISCQTIRRSMEHLYFFGGLGGGLLCAVILVWMPSQRQCTSHSCDHIESQKLAIGCKTKHCKIHMVLLEWRWRRWCWRWRGSSSIETARFGMSFPAISAELTCAWALGVEVTYEDSGVAAGLGFAAIATIPAIVQTMTINAPGSRHSGSNCFRSFLMRYRAISLRQNLYRHTHAQ